MEGKVKNNQVIYKINSLILWKPGHWIKESLAITAAFYQAWLHSAQTQDGHICKVNFLTKLFPVYATWAPGRTRCNLLWQIFHGVTLWLPGDSSIIQEYNTL